MAADSSLEQSAPRRVVLPSTGDVMRYLGHLISSTFRICMRYRVTGLAAEAGFFALLSLPPLVLGLVASVGYVGHRMGRDVLVDLQQRIVHLADGFVTSEVVRKTIVPTFNELARGDRLDVVSIGFLVSLWSGSRALNVYVDTVSIMYGLGGRRGIIRTRALSFTLYVLTLVVGTVLVPLLLVGPGLLAHLLHRWFDGLPSLAWLGLLYWPVVIIVSVAGLTTLYHIATPVRKSWVSDLPGAALALVIWLVVSVVLRVWLAASIGGSSIYGPLSAPIVILIWFYFLAIAVLIGAALNAAVAGEQLPAP